MRIGGLGGTSVDGIDPDFIGINPRLPPGASVGIDNGRISGIRRTDCPAICFDRPHHVLGVVLGGHRFGVVGVIGSTENKLAPRSGLFAEVFGKCRLVANPDDRFSEGGLENLPRFASN